MSALRGELETQIHYRLVEKLAQSEARYRSLVETLQDVVFRCDDEGKITFINRAWTETTGYAQAQTLGQTFNAFIFEDDQSLFDRVCTQALIKREAIQHELRFVSCYGTVVWFSLTSRPQEGGGTIGSLNNISARKQTEEALQESEKRASKLALVASRTHNSVIICDAQGRIEWVNESFTRLTEYALDEVVGKSPGGLLQGPDSDPATVELMRFHLSRGEGCKVQIVNYTKSGNPYWNELDIQPGFDASGQLSNFVAVQNDISEYKSILGALQKSKEEAQQAKAQAEEANLAKSTFLSRMSHELRTPLNAILGFAQIFEMQTHDEKQARNVGHILKAGYHLLDLINEVLDISRIETGELKLELEALSLDQVLSESLDLIQPLAQTYGHELHPPSRIEPDIRVLADEQRLKQVLINLLSNAVKYTGERGQVYLDWQDEGAHIHIAVRDTGPGIAPEYLERLFTPFDRLGAEQQNVEGTGIGLSLSQRLVQLMGSDIEVESKLGEGSCFSFRLRKSDPAPRIRAREAADSVIRMLYIEDKPSNIEVLDAIVAQYEDFQLTAALEGRVGIELAREQRPELILLDVHLPDLSGYEVLKRLKNEQSTSGIPVIVISADATQQQRERMMGAGAQAFLSKPLRVNTFLNTVHNVLE